MADFEKRVDSDNTGDNEKLSTEDLAALVVDALLRARIVKADDVKRAITIAMEEIDVRKTLGDY
jgi:hypothetical protein